MRIGVALPDARERDAVAGWLGASGMEVDVLVDGCLVRADVSGLSLDCLLVDAALLATGYLASVRQHDRRVPVVVVGHAGDAAGRRPRDTSEVERPLDAQAVTLAVSLAHSEGRQSRSRPRKAAGRFPADVAGIDVDIIDVSADGLRLELPRGATARLGPQFRLRVPMVGLDVAVRRAWVGRGRGDRVQCGAVLLAPTPAQQRAWARVLDLAGSAAAVVSGPAADVTAEMPPVTSLRGSALRSASALMGVVAGRFLRASG